MLAGDLSEFSLPDVFQLLALSRKSGSLQLPSATGRGQGRVHVVDGEVAFALADDRCITLGARLVGDGHLSVARLEELVDAYEGAPAARLAVGMLRAAEASEEVLADLVVAQIHEAMSRLVTLEQGPFTFDADEPVAWTGPRLQAVEVLAEAQRRAEEWAAVAEQLPDDDAVLVLAPHPPGEGAITLDRAQWQLLSLVDGERTLRDVAELSGSDLFATGRSVGALVDAGLVDVVVEDGGTAVAELLAGRAVLRRLERLVAGEPDGEPTAAEVDRSALAGDPGDVDEGGTVDAADGYDRTALVRELAASGAGYLDDTPTEEREVSSEADPQGGDAPPHVEDGADRSLATVGAGEGDEPGDLPRLTRDDDVNRGLLLRLIDGVKGA